MPLRAFLLLTIVAILLLTTNGCRAAVVQSYGDLTLTKAMAIQESGRRLALDNLALKALENERRHRRITADDYDWQSRDLMTRISVEASYQNELLTKDSFSLNIQLPDGAAKVLRTVGKLSVEIPLEVIVAILKSGVSITP